MTDPTDETDYKASPIVNGSSKSKHSAGVWLGLRRFDTSVKYLEFVALVVVLVLDRQNPEWYEEKYMWWITGGTLALNFFMQSVHMFLYYVANRLAKDRYFWPPVFPAEWGEGDHGTGFSQHYKFFYIVKAAVLAYLGWMIFQEKLDEFFIYPTLFLSFLLIVFDLLYYLFELF